MSSKRDTYANTYDVNIQCASIRGPQPAVQSAPKPSAAVTPLAPWLMGITAQGGNLAASLPVTPSLPLPLRPNVASPASPTPAFHDQKLMRSKMLGTPVCTFFFFLILPIWNFPGWTFL